MFVPRADFSLAADFLAEYEGTQPNWGPLGYLVYKRTYANKLDNGETEEFWQTCQRVVEGIYQIQKGHCRSHGLPWSDAKAQRSAQEAYQRMYAFKWLPPGRGLSKMGTEHVFKIGGACLNNCGFTSTRNIGNSEIPNSFSDPFTWLMDMSMLGVGVGFDTEGAGLITIHKPKETVEFQIPDSREGWVQYIQQLLQSYVDPLTPFPVADYSLIRPKGAPIKGFGGTASGPESMVLLTERLTKLLDMYDGKKVDSRCIVDIANSIGECVVAGGVRRTAEISFGKPADLDFLALKDFANNPDASEWARWASNNSVIVDRDSDFSGTASLTSKNGEPGYLFLRNAQEYGRMIDPPNFDDSGAEGANPCVEQTLWDHELCCLVETFPSNCDDFADYRRTLKFAYLYAKTVTMVPTHNERTNAVMLRNRRIGCSQTGIQDNIGRIGLSKHLEWCDHGYQYIRELDSIYSNWLCIRPSIKCTSVKPSGSVSKLPGVREGIHEAKGEYEIQSIRINDTSPLLARLEEAGYLIEDDVKAKNTKVVYFPMHYPGQRSTPTSMWEQLELAAMMQAYWADNQVSVTIDFDPVVEGPQIQRALEMYAHRLKGLSFLPRKDHGYAQAPKRVCDQAEYEAYKSKLGTYSFAGLSTHEVEDKFCDGGVCEVPIANADDLAAKLVVEAGAAE